MTSAAVSTIMCENRIVKITEDAGDVAKFSYDALGRRVEKQDCKAGANTRRFYHNYNWQVLSEYDGSNTYVQSFVYGNYIDEVLLSTGAALRYYVHDHLFSPVAAIDSDGDVAERYEYDAYGDCHVLDYDFSADADNVSDHGNPYLFTGRRLDILNNTNLRIYYYRNRYYDPHTGRFLTHDPLGYVDGMNQYTYAACNPVRNFDPNGFWNKDVHRGDTIEWAEEAGFIKKCAKIIGTACNNVDAALMGKSPWPIIGDASYHFDTDPSGNMIVPGARMQHFNEHLQIAENLLAGGAVQWGRIVMALTEFGTGLHPLQDTFSHNAAHSATIPKYHAPKPFCIAMGDPKGKKIPFCKWARQNSPNWDNPHLPDDKQHYKADYEATGVETKSRLKTFLERNFTLGCWCAKDDTL